MTLVRNLRAACLAIAGTALAFTACGGGAASAGPSTSNVQIQPPTLQVPPGGTVAFRASAAAGAALSVQWEVTEPSGGSIDASGFYTAPQVGSTATVHVVARSSADPAVFGTAVVTVTPGAQPVVTISVSPATASLTAGSTTTFTAQVGGTANTGVTWSVQESGGGSVSASGAYTAPATAGTYHVVATSQADATKSATATVTVTSSGGNVTGLAAQMAVLAQKAVFFEHASVGSNVEDGLDGLRDQVSGPRPTIRPAVNGTVGASAIAAALGPGVFFGNWFPSQNGFPFDKISTFESLMTGGVGPRADIAMMKFCFTDLPTSDSAVTASSVFAAYRSMMDRLRAAYPGVRFVHWTMPLTRDGAGSNGPREAFNDMIRTTYGGREPVFDLALVESTRPDGTREMDGGVASLYSGYTSDGGHLNSTGSDVVARALLAVLANL